jgi:hypothetical protein
MSSVDTWTYDYRNVHDGYPDAETRRSFTKHTGKEYDHGLVCNLFRAQRLEAEWVAGPRHAPAVAPRPKRPPPPPSPPPTIVKRNGNEPPPVPKRLKQVPITSLFHVAGTDTMLQLEYEVNIIDD